MIWASKYFIDPSWLYALLLLIFFILFYFLRPKPKYVKIPSLMFFFKDLGKDRTTNFLRKFLQDLLFYLQLAVLLLLLFALAKPYINVEKESLFKNTVIVLDDSASMQAKYDSGTRFSEAVKLAKENLGSINTLIIARNTPEIVLEEENAKNVKDYLSDLSPSSTTTNLYDAIVAAGGAAKGEARIAVISDFIDTDTDNDLGALKRSLEAQDIKVDFIKVSKEVSNVGIIDLSIDDEKTSVVIRNYDPVEHDVRIKVNDLEETRKLQAGSQDVFSFSTPPGANKVELKFDDGFALDNTAYISTPSDTEKKVLMITNNANIKKTFIYNALDVMKGMKIDVAIPPKIPALDDYDIFIFKDINPKLILPGTFQGAKKQAETRGASVIILAQPDFLNLNYYGLMPLRYNDTIKAKTNILSKSESMTSNIEFGVVGKYFRAGPLEDVNTATIAIAEDNTPLISYAPLGGGKVLYYGILDEDREADAYFAKSPSYFVFWKRMIDFMTDTPSIKSLNYKTGAVIKLKETLLVTTPSGKIKTDTLNLEDTGIYALTNRAYAANILSDKESDINAKESFTEDATGAGSDRFKEKVPYELTTYLAILAIIFLMLEFLYIKIRGDL